MLPEHERENFHDRFRQLSALANADDLTASEWCELKEHLSVCNECRGIHNEYQLLHREGMPMLASAHAKPNRPDDWNDAETRSRLFARIQETEEVDLAPPVSKSRMGPMRVPALFTANRVLWATAVACVVVSTAFGAYQLGIHAGDSTAEQVQVAAQYKIQGLAVQKRTISNKLESETKRLRQLETETLQEKQDLARLREELRLEDARMNQVEDSKTATETQLQTALQQRDLSSAQLQTAEQNYEAARAALASLQTERDKAVLRTASLESRVESLTAVKSEQEHQLRDVQQYLSSDRDIRELMGARNLYIADVYDVDSRSRTRKPYGRVFYTQGKSLIFYAFDLERKPGMENASASAFQVWGKTGSDAGQPLNLGILYQDSKANRRWVLRFDDPKKLAEINAIFVTVEPNGGSRKPTSEPLLFALLRNQANHP